MKKNGLRYILLIFVANLLLLVGCTENSFYQEFQPLSISGWDISDTLEFNFEIKDTTKKYNLYLNLRHRDIFEYQNVYFKLITISPDNISKNNIISIPLSQDDGTWLGTCTGDICFINTPIMKRFRFVLPGKYKILVLQEMRVNKLKNLIDLGLKLNFATKYKKDEKTN